MRVLLTSFLLTFVLSGWQSQATSDGTVTLLQKGAVRMPESDADNGNTAASSETSADSQPDKIMATEEHADGEAQTEPEDPNEDSDETADDLESAEEDYDEDSGEDEDEVGLLEEGEDDTDSDEDSDDEDDENYDEEDRMNYDDDDEEEDSDAEHESDLLESTGEGTSNETAQGATCNICVVTHPTAIDGTHGALTVLNLDHQMICLTPIGDGKCSKAFDKAKKHDAGTMCYTNSNGFAPGAFGLPGTTKPRYTVGIRNWWAHTQMNSKLNPKNARATKSLGTITAVSAEVAIHEIQDATKGLMPNIYWAEPTHSSDCHRLVRVVDKALQQGTIGKTKSKCLKGGCTEATTAKSSYARGYYNKVKRWLPASWGAETR